MRIQQKLQNMVKENKDEVIRWRRYLHENPELSFKEKKTSQFIFDTLESFGNLEVSRPTKTSVMAKLIGPNTGPTIALRADMDALPINEENDMSFISKNPGVMHACGHDGHTAMLLGTVKIISEFKDNINGEVRFIFQHGEEQLPGGASEMVAAGIMEGVDFVFGAHLWSQFNSGDIFTKTGPLMAAADVFNIEIIGEGGHSAQPHNTKDALAIGTQVVNNLQHVLSRYINPFDDIVLSVTKFTSGSSHSIIPNSSEIVGSVRSFNQETRKMIPKYMERIVKGITYAHAADYKFDYQTGYNPVINDENATKVVKKSIIELFGEDALLIQDPMMISEDFSAYQQVSPGCFFIIGAGDQEKKRNYPHHHPKFDIDENSLEIGVKIFIDTIFKFNISK